MNSFVKKALTHLGILLVLLGITAIYFQPQLQGKVPQQGDIMQYRGMSQEIREFEEATGETTLWTNSMFGGMPTYQINTVYAGNNLRYVDRVLRFGVAEPLGRFFIGMVGFYILMMCLGVNPLLGAVGALAFGLTTNNFILFEAGHMTKIKTINYLPLVAAGLLMAFRNKNYLWGGLLFALGMGLNVFSNHPQMTYYFAMTLLVFGVAQLIYSIRQNEIPHFLKAVGVLVVGGLLGLGSAASNLMVTYEYSRDTMRGEPILQAENTSTGESSSEVEGLAWDYAMQWSNGTIDLFASFIPGVAGGGSSEPVGADSNFRQALLSRGYQVPAEMDAPLYWGDLPFTSGPAYFGAVVFFFFLLGAILVKGPAKWWLVIGTLLTFMLSMGENLEWFNRPVFEYFPLYNKFRTPNSILSVTAVLVPILGFMGLHHIITGKSDEKTMLRALYIAGGISGGIALFFWLIGPSMFDFSTATDAQYVQNYGISADVLPADRQALMRKDAFRTLVLILLSGGLLWAYLKNLLQQQNIILLGIGLLVVFDLWTVNKRYVNEENFVTPTNLEANFQPRPADQLILKDSDPHFRVLDLTQNDPFANSFTSYFHKSIGGYHAAKLQRYQDIIDRHLRQNNERVLNMLNTKYFIVPGQNGQPSAQVNMDALGNAWYVNNVQVVNSANEEIAALRDFNPEETAIIHQEFSEYLQGFNAQKDSTGTITLTSYEPNHLTYQSNAGSEQLAVFSEIWYGPDKGWQAFIDGEPAEHVRANYILRAMRVPAGQHTVEFIFDPQTYETGKALSLIFSSLIIVGLLGMVGFYGFKAYQRAANEPPKPKPEPETKPKAQQRKPTARSRNKKGGKKRK